MAIQLDTLKIVEQLEAAGYTTSQAKAQTTVLANAISEEAAWAEDKFAAKSTSTQELSGVKAEVGLLRQELKSEVASMKQELKSEAGSLRKELHSELGLFRKELYAEIDSMRQELKSEVGSMRQELKSEVGSLRQDLDAKVSILREEFKALNSDTKSEMIRWIVGVGMLQTGLVAGLLLKLVP